MSRVNMLLTTKDVPRYMREIASRLYLTTDYTENDVAGYTFKLYGKWKLGYEGQLKSDCEKLIAWCKRWYADAYVVSEHFWYIDVPGEFPKYQMQRAYRTGYRNYNNYARKPTP